MAPTLTGRGWGWVGFPAAEAVSRLPGPPLEDPPTSPPHPLTGALWGERGGAPGACVASNAFRSAAATQRAAKPTAPFTRCGDPAADVTPSESKVSDWRGGRASAGHLCDSAVCPQAARHRAWRVAGVTIWHERSARERNATKCSAAQCASSGPVRQAGPSVAYPRRTSGLAIRGHGKGRLQDTAGAAGQAVFCARDVSDGQTWRVAFGLLRHLVDV